MGGKQLELVRVTHTEPRELRGSREYRNLSAVVEMVPKSER